MSVFSVLLKSSTFWTALVSIIGMLLLRFTAMPEDIWIAIASFLGACVSIIFGNEVSKGIGTQIARSMLESREEEKRNLTLMGRG